MCTGIMGSASPAGTPVSAHNMDLGGEALCSAVNCGGADPALVIAAVLATTSFVLLALATFVHISDGASLVNAEQRRTRSEREAFRLFASRVEALDPSAVGMGQTQHGESTLVRAALDDPRLGEVRDAYRETVMAVPHFEAEYDESLAASMAAEFGEDVATAVVSGSRLSPALQEELVRRSHRAVDHRATLLRTLAAEDEALAECRERLAAVDHSLDSLERQPHCASSYDELVGRWRRLRKLEADTRQIQADRQRELHDRRTHATRRDDDLSFYDYLYRSLSVSFPVLADGLGVLDRIRDAERRVVDELTTRV